MTVNAIQMKIFTRLRYDYYCAARTLSFHKMNLPAGLLFGYTIEYHLKQARIVDADGRKDNLQRTHDFIRLWDTCVADGLFIEFSLNKGG